MRPKRSTSMLQQHQQQHQQQLWPYTCVVADGRILCMEPEWTLRDSNGHEQCTFLLLLWVWSLSASGRFLFSCSALRSSLTHLLPSLPHHPLPPFITLSLSSFLFFTSSFSTYSFSSSSSSESSPSPHLLLLLLHLYIHHLLTSSFFSPEPHPTHLLRPISLLVPPPLRPHLVVLQFLRSIHLVRG